VLLLLLLGTLLLKVVIEESAELAGAVVSDLFPHKLAHLFETLCAENASAITFAAWKAFLVDLRTAALETINLFFNSFLSGFFAVWHQDLAVSIGVCLVDHSTVSLVSKIDGRKTVTADVVGGDFNLAAGGCVLLTCVGVGVSENHVLGDCGDVNFWDQIAHIGSHVNRLHMHIVRADCHLVDYRLGLKGLVKGNTGRRTFLLFGQVFEVAGGAAHSV